MNEVYVSGQLLTKPRYDIIPSTSDAIVRGLMDLGESILPILCCNEYAKSARETLLGIHPGENVFVSGELKGDYYTDAVGSKNYLLYLIVNRIARTKEQLLDLEPVHTTLEYKGLPFGVPELEDILRYMER